MSKFKDAQVTGRYIADLVRRRALAAIATHDKKLGNSYEKLATSIRKDLLAAGYNPAQIRRLLDKNLAGTLKERVQVVEQAIHDSAREGSKLARETYSAVFEPSDIVLASNKPVFAPSAQPALKAASERIRGKVSVDGLSLSGRFHKNDTATLRGMSHALESSVRAGETITRTAERLLDEGNPVVRLPKYVQELAEAARGADKASDYAAAVKKWRGQMERLGQGAAKEAGPYTIRSATQQLVTDLRKATPAEVDKIVDRWVLERARHQARVIARHESVEAFRESSMESWRDEDWVVAVQWSMSGSHPRPDICDVVANQDLHGLGPGRYPKDDVPARHVSCMCTLSAVSDRDHFKRELAKAKGEEEPPRPWESGKRVTGDEWLRQQTDAARHAIAGPTRSKIVAAGGSVMQTSGAFTPVHQLLGHPKPRVLRGPGVNASALVAADRATMVQPFPELPAAPQSSVLEANTRARRPRKGPP